MVKKTKKTKKTPTVVLEPPLRAPPLHGTREMTEPATDPAPIVKPAAPAPVITRARPSEAELNWMFSRHSLSEDQAERCTQISEAAKNLARVILQVCPPCADRSAAMRKVREARMTANASITLHGSI